MTHFAKFYRCALQVNPYSYVSYRGEKHQDEYEYNKQVLNICLENNIKVVGLADHGRVETSESLRKILSDNGILVFPGFEITTAEKIHIVCLFPPETPVNELNRILGQLGMPEIISGTEKSSLSCLSIANKVKDNNGFWYAAHITSDNGILKLGQLQNIWKDDLLVAGQIPDSLENVDPNYKNIINNRDPNYKRENPIAYINAKDVSKPSDLQLETATTLIKMSELSFKSFKLAFTDPKSRIRLNSSQKINYKSSILEISIDGGYLDGIHIDFSDELNTIIGGRGTGKSTLITLIRYVLGNYNHDSHLKKTIDDLVENNLGTSGEISILVSSYAQNGQKYKIVKRYNQNVSVFNDDGTLSKLTVEDILPTIEIYGQNELIEAIKSPETITNIVKRLILIDEEILSEKESAYKNLQENTKELIEVNIQLDRISEHLGELPKNQEKLDKYNEIGFEEKLKPIVDLEKQDSYLNSLNKNVKKYSTEIKKIDIPNLSEDTTNNYIKEIKEKIEAFNKEVDNISEELKTEYNNLENYLDDIIPKWEIEKTNKEKEFSSLIKDIDGIQDKTNKEVVEEYRRLVSEVEKSKPNQELQGKLLEQKEKLLEDRKTLLENCKASNSKYSRSLEKQIKGINKKKFDGKIKVEIFPLQHKEEFLNMLKSISGIGDKSISAIDEYVAFNCITFVENLKKGSEELAQIYKINRSVAEKIINMPEEFHWKIQEIQLRDITEISLNVNGAFKEMSNLSKGQQCTALLNVLLVENEDPLIIDQPEDNLDNAYIADSFVQTIRKYKPERQYIFATHNANIPVFGDAELIVTLEERNGQGEIADGGIGSIDSQNVKKHVIKLLEGGEDAFKIREKKYRH